MRPRVHPSLAWATGALVASLALPREAPGQARPTPPTRPGIRCAPGSEEKWLDAKDATRDRGAFLCGDNYYLYLEGTGAQPPKNRCDLTLYRADDDLPVAPMKLTPDASGRAMAIHRLHGRRVVVELLTDVDLAAGRCHVRVTVR